jgi:acetyltransferase-like isoleucine patch superfamily enzyme
VDRDEQHYHARGKDWGCIVAAGSIVVTPSDSTVAGNPARVIKYGFG